MQAVWGSSHGLHVLNYPDPAHQASGALDLAFGPASAFAEFAHWAMDHRTFVVSLDRVLPVPLSPLRPLPRRSRFAEADALLGAFIPRPCQIHSPKNWKTSSKRSLTP